MYYINIRNFQLFGGIITCHGNGSYDPTAGTLNVDADLSVRELFQGAPVLGEREIRERPDKLFDEK